MKTIESLIGLALILALIGGSFAVLNGLNPANPITQVKIEVKVKEQQMPTPQQKKVIVIDDDLGWGNILKLHLASLGFSVRVCPTFCDEPDANFFVIDGQDPQEQIVGPGFIRSIRSAHPDAFIVGISGRLDTLEAGQSETIRIQFMVAGANAVINKGGSIEEQLKALFSQ